MLWLRVVLAACSILLCEGIRCSATSMSAYYSPAPAGTDCGAGVTSCHKKDFGTIAGYGCGPCPDNWPICDQCDGEMCNKDDMPLKHETECYTEDKKSTVKCMAPFKNQGATCWIKVKPGNTLEDCRLGGKCDSGCSDKGSITAGGIACTAEEITQGKCESCEGKLCNTYIEPEPKEKPKPDETKPKEDDKDDDGEGGEKEKEQHDGRSGCNSYMGAGNTATLCAALMALSAVYFL